MSAYMGAIPNLTIMAPSDEIELKNMIKTCADFDNGPIVLRYPILGDILRFLLIKSLLF